MKLLYRNIASNIIKSVGFIQHVAIDGDENGQGLWLNVSSNFRFLFEDCYKMPTHENAALHRPQQMVCLVRFWLRFFATFSVVIVPDTSRVLRRSADGLAGLEADVHALFGRPRAFVRCVI